MDGEESAAKECILLLKKTKVNSQHPCQVAQLPQIPAPEDPMPSGFHGHQ